ncbi:PAS domain S-box protein [Hydrogenophaga sp.]|uniref:PAS domain-containing sensor histidine kinase n=1 Tax=Hydrogenophaga sp. TaxID=1904254 RepID=UPI0035620B91
MSAYYPYDASSEGPVSGNERVSARELEMQRVINELRAENARLRRRSADLVGDAEQADNDVPALPRPLHTKLLSTRDQSADEAARVEYESLFEALSSVFPIGIFRTDGAGVLTHVDPALQHIFDLEAKDFPDFGWLRQVHPDDLERVRKLWQQGVVDGEPLSLEFRLLRKHQGQANILIRNVPLRDEDNAVVGQLGFVQDITSQRTLQADARIKEELNRQIIANSPDCTKVLDLQGHVLQMTMQGCRLLEIDNFEDVRGQDWSQWWPAENEELARAAIESAQQGRVARFIGFASTFKGRPKWWDNLISPILDADGQPIMLLAVSRDISEQYEQRNEIQQLNAELESRVQRRTEELAQANLRIQDTLRNAQALYDQAPCGYHSVNAQGVYVLINQTELNWLGYARAEVVGKRNFRDYVTPPFLESMESRLRQLMAGEPLEPVEVGLRRRDGTQFVALISSTAEFSDLGHFVRSNSTLIDITERKAAEDALHAQRSFLQTVTNSVPVQLAFFDRDLICRFANASFSRGRSDGHADVVGMPLSAVLDPKDYQDVSPKLAAALKGQHQRFEGLRAFPDGNTFYASIEYTPYCSGDEVMGLFIQVLDITERKASEDQVKLANDQLQVAYAQSQDLYHRAPCGYHSLGPDGLYVSINDTELHWLGYSREEVVGKKRFHEFIHAHHVPQLEDRLQRLITEGRLDGAEYELRRRDGSTFHALLSSSAVWDEQGKFLRSNTTVIDISHRKEAEDALLASQRFLQAITDHVPGLIVYLDNTLHIQFANAEHKRLFGMDPTELVGQHIKKGLPPGVWTEVAPTMRAALAGEAQHFEAWRTLPDGASIYVSTTYIPDIQADVVQGLFVQVIDITERKRIEERVSLLNEELEQRIQERSAELLESEQRFRLMVDNLREYSIYFMDADGTISDWTDSAQRMKGYSPTEMLGKHYAHLFGLTPPEERLDAAKQALRLAASRGQHVLHTWLSRKDGSQFWAHSLLIALRDDDGELRGFAKINRDMSDAKRLEDLMRNINDELENRVTERTEQLVAANKDMEAFSYSVSHDLRSPLRHISSFVSLLEEQLGSQGDEIANRYLSTIGSSARHMSQLIDGLLAFSRLGRSAVNLAPVDFSMLVEAVVGQIAHDTEGRVVEWVIAPDLPVVQGDALLLREVWANLLGNAFKYTRPRECARIEVGWSVDPAVGYTFFVRDNGVGFDTKYAQKLFGVFQRLHRASDFEGTGIGLALTRRILERHNGNIWADSQLGKSSVFYFSLPFDGASASDAQSDSFFAALGP